MIIIKALYTVPVFKENNSSIPSCPKKVILITQLISNHDEGREAKN